MIVASGVTVVLHAAVFVVVIAVSLVVVLFVSLLFSSRLLDHFGFPLAVPIVFDHCFCHRRYCRVVFSFFCSFVVVLLISDLFSSFSSLSLLLFVVLVPFCCCCSSSSGSAGYWLFLDLVPLDILYEQ